MLSNRFAAAEATLVPCLLAGSESGDAYEQEFIKMYCEGWYRKCRYAMFREALALLQQIWTRRAQEIDHFRVLWGIFVGS